MSEPKLRIAIIYMALALMCWMFAYLVGVGQNASGGNVNPNQGANLAPLRMGLGFGMTIMGIVLAIGAGFSLGNWIWYHWNERLEERKRALAITPTVELAREISRLRPDQTALLPTAKYQVEISMAVTEHGRIYFLKTPFLDVPLVWLDHYLNVLCSRTELYPIRRFGNDSKDQKYAQAFTAWATQAHLYLAFPANGPDPAQWMSPGARERVVEMIWGEEVGE